VDLAAQSAADGHDVSRAIVVAASADVKVFVPL
jgi:hypothetical protein